MKKEFLAAKKARVRAYAPYSKFFVGAALSKGSRIFSGFNIENASFGATICAERAALVSALVAGVKSFDSLTVVTKGPKASSPCGLCLQMLSEFLSPETPVHLATPKGVERRLKFKDFLPLAFQKSELR